MQEALTPWITPAILILGFLYLDRSIRNTRSELREDMKGLRGEVADLRQHVDHQIGELRERMAHLEGLLEGLREAITRRNAA